MDGSSKTISNCKTLEELRRKITSYLQSETATKCVIIQSKEYDCYGLITKETKEYYYEW